MVVNAKSSYEAPSPCSSVTNNKTCYIYIFDTVVPLYTGRQAEFLNSILKISKDNVSARLFVRHFKCIIIRLKPSIHPCITNLCDIKLWFESICQRKLGPCTSYTLQIEYLLLMLLPHHQALTYTPSSISFALALPLGTVSYSGEGNTHTFLKRGSCALLGLCCTFIAEPEE